MFGTDHGLSCLRRRGCRRGRSASGWGPRRTDWIGLLSQLRSKLGDVAQPAAQLRSIDHLEREAVVASLQVMRQAADAELTRAGLKRARLLPQLSDLHRRPRSGSAQDAPPCHQEGERLAHQCSRVCGWRADRDLPIDRLRHQVSWLSQRSAEDTCAPCGVGRLQAKKVADSGGPARMPCVGWGSSAPATGPGWGPRAPITGAGWGARAPITEPGLARPRTNNRAVRGLVFPRTSNRASAERHISSSAPPCHLCRSNPPGFWRGTAGDSLRRNRTRELAGPQW